MDMMRHAEIEIAFNKRNTPRAPAPPDARWRDIVDRMVPSLSQSSPERTEFNGNVDYGGEKPRRSRRGGEK